MTTEETTASVWTLTRETRYAVTMFVAVPTMGCGMNRIELSKADSPSIFWKLFDVMVSHCVINVGFGLQVTGVYGCTHYSVV